MRKAFLFLFVACMFCAIPSHVDANTTVRVVQVSSPVTLSEDVDYIITSTTPFTDEGTVDVTNTEHAVLILDAVKPSKALALLSHVTINGERAVNATNCQVKIHNRGCIIMPYKKDVKPLTVYSEKDFGGEAVSDFGLENSGGYMNTLSADKLNNRIHSFKLKRGYMVTFSTQPKGRGYSRCFIAANSDLEMPELPAILDGRISSYRIFKWNDTSKAGIANDTRSDPCSKLNVTSCYSFGLGEDRGLDTECVPHHIYEDWPSASACGSVGYSPHMKTNNEPGNSADDHPQTVDQILANWENLMATGMRLCSPSSHDGSLNHLRDFLDSIDARGWRCDIIDLHCYWTEGSFNNIKGSWVDRYHRPVWISEWVWGASWNNNGIFGIATGNNRNNPTASQLEQNKNAVQSICNKLNSWDYIERYFYWNSEANCSKLYLDGQLTPAGQFYSNMNTGVGYNGRYEFVPTTPRQYGLSNFKQTTDGNNVILSWNDQNGEYNQVMDVQCKLKGGQWETIAVIDMKEAAAKYVYTVENAPEGALYRIHITDLNGVEHYTNDDMEVGDAVIDKSGMQQFAGGNLIVNGDFDFGTTDWNAGNGNALEKPYFQVVRKGGYNGGAYLQAYGSGGIDHMASIKKVIELEPNQDYVFSVAARNGGSYLRLNLSEDGVAESAEVARVGNTTDWRKQTFTFNSGNYTKALLAFRWLAGTAMIDKVELRKLYPTRQAAVADGVTNSKKIAEVAEQYNTALPELNSELNTKLASLEGNDDEALYLAQDAIDAMLAAMADKDAIDSLLRIANSVRDMKFGGQDALESAMEQAENCNGASNITAARKQLQSALEQFYTTSEASKQPEQPNFASSNGWQVKVGTYKGGDQRTNTVGGKTCWNAWWSGIGASQGNKQTMEIRQNVENVPEGLYSLECKATTQHYCLSDQHGYLVCGQDTASTTNLKSDYFDLPVGNIWETLSTTPLYVEEGGKITIGFVGSKQGAVDNAWHPVGEPTNSGDKREGWWCATDFILRYHPLHKQQVNAGEWKTICLPYTYEVPENAKFYKIAGILTDHSKICIEEVTTIEAGMPCIFLANADNLVFYEYGEKVASPLAYDTQNNLRGFFETSARAPKGSYVLLANGAWIKVDQERPQIENYSAIIYKLDGMNEISSWDGPTMNIFDDADGIHYVGSTSQNATYFTTSGQQVSNPHGITIEVKNGKTRKTVKK